MIIRLVGKNNTVLKQVLVRFMEIMLICDIKTVQYWVRYLYHSLLTLDDIERELLNLFIASQATTLTGSCTTIKQVKNNASYAIKRNFISWEKFKAESIKQKVSFIVDVEFKATSRYILKETVKNDKKEPNNENSRGSHRFVWKYVMIF